MAGLLHLVHHLRRLVAPHEPVSDSVLLDRFVRGRDEDAFAALVARHGPMVLRVCRGVLADPAGAEDCFQGVFLVLARKAKSLRQPAALASWLHGVALRVASEARKAGCRRRLYPMPVSEPPDPDPDPLAQLTARELLVAVDEEVQRLPAACRLPVILCCLENLTQEETAHRLGWTVGSVKARLERGRKRLQARLAKRGLTLSAALVALTVSPSAASAAVGPGLRAATPKAALTFAAGVAAEEAPGTASVLAEAALRSLAVGKLKTLALMAVFCAFAIVGTGSLVWSELSEQSLKIGAQGLHTPVVDPGAVQPTPVPNASPRLDKSGDPLPPDALARLGTTRFRLGNNIWGMALSPDGKTAISVGFDRTQFWDAATGKVIRSIDSRQGGDGHAIACSPDGRLAASISQADGNEAAEPDDDRPRLPSLGKHGLLYLWEASTGKQLAKIRLSMNDTRCLAFAPDGLVLAVGGFSAKLGAMQGSSSASALSLWRWNGKSLMPLWEAKPDHEAPVGRLFQGIKALAFSPDGKHLATGGQASNIIRIWDVSQGKEVGQMRASGTSVGALAFAPNAQGVASGSDNGEVALWEPASGMKKWQSQQPGGVRALAFAPDGKFLAASGGTDSGWRIGQESEPFLVLLNPNSGREVRRINPVRECVVSVAFSQDGKVLAAAMGGTIRIWDAIMAKERSLSIGHDSGVSSVAVSEDGKSAATAADDGLIVLWDLASGIEKRRLPGHPAGVQAAGFVPGGKLLASASIDQTVRIWDVATGDEVRRLQGSPGGSMHFMAISPDGQTLAAGDNITGVVHVWNVATGQPLSALKFGAKRGRGVTCLAFSPDGKILAGGERMLSVGYRGKNAWIQLWDAKTGTSLREFPAYEYAVASLAFTPDSHTLASTGWDGKSIGLWDVESGKGLFELPCASNIGVVAFSPDGKTMAWSGLNGEVWLWETASKKLRRKFSGHSSFVPSLAFSPDGRALVSGSRDTTAMVWDVAGLGSDPTTTPASLSATMLRSFWSALADSDAEKAGRAIRFFTANPKHAVPFIVERLRELPPGDLQRIPKLVADLDSTIFKVREAAEKTLDGLGKLAEPSLRDALASQPSLEVRRRIEKLLTKRETVNLSPEALQTLRAMEALEHIRSPEARQALEDFARQASDVYFAQQAQAAADRLRKR